MLFEGETVGVCARMLTTPDDSVGLKQDMAPLSTSADPLGTALSVDGAGEFSALSPKVNRTFERGTTSISGRWPGRLLLFS